MTADDIRLGLALLVGVGAFATSVWAIVSGRHANKLATARFEHDRDQDDDESRDSESARITERAFELRKIVDEAVDAKVQPLIERDRIRTQAFIRVLRSIARQWPAGLPGPYLDPRDLDAIEDTIPPHWIQEPETEPRP